MESQLNSLIALAFAPHESCLRKLSLAIKRAIASVRAFTSLAGIDKPLCSYGPYRAIRQRARQSLAVQTQTPWRPLRFALPPCREGRRHSPARTAPAVHPHECAAEFATNIP